MQQLRRGDFDAIEREFCRRRLSNFIARAWPNIDPQTFVPGWHIDAIADHLQACANGEITRLLINVPPGSSKSTITSVFFPAWLWGPFGWPSAKFISASFELTLATRDNRKTRQLIESDWYQNLWPTALKQDQNQKTSFENEALGFRQANAVKSMTGRRGDVVVWDDPLSPEKAYSDADRDTANRVFSETLPLRLVDPELSVIIVIMQRLHEDDVSGHILANDIGYEHLVLPMEYDPDRKCQTSIGFEDPRTEEGELLCAKRFSREVVERDKKVLGAFATSGQFQQSPYPRGGSLFQREKFNFLDVVPSGTRWCRGWDFAATDDANAARTAGVKLGIAPDDRIIIAHCRKGQYSPKGVKNILHMTARQDGISVQGSIPQDPGSAGKAYAESLLTDKKCLLGFPYTCSTETGDKTTRAMPLAAQVEAGNVYLVEDQSDPWVKDFVDEAVKFPAGKFKDQVDAASRAFNHVSGSAPTMMLLGGRNA